MTALVCEVARDANRTGQSLAVAPEPEDEERYFTAAAHLADGLDRLARGFEDLGRPEDVTLAGMSARAATIFRALTAAGRAKVETGARVAPDEARRLEAELAWLPVFDRELTTWHERSCGDVPGSSPAGDRER